jgi:hypothetical protein
MTKRITLEVDLDSLNQVILDDLIDHYDNHLDGDSELENALLKVIEYYSTEKQWKQFKKIREV